MDDVDFFVIVLVFVDIFEYDNDLEFAEFVNRFNAFNLVCCDHKHEDKYFFVAFCRVLYVWHARYIVFLHVYHYFVCIIIYYVQYYKVIQPSYNF